MSYNKEFRAQISARKIFQEKDIEAAHALTDTGAEVAVFGEGEISDSGQVKYKKITYYDEIKLMSWREYCEIKLPANITLHAAHRCPRPRS